MEEFSRIRREIHAALSDSVDTRTTIEKLRELIGKGDAVPNCLLLQTIASYSKDLFAVLGVISELGDIGFPMESESDVDMETTLMPYLNALASFRERVRN
ncbi:unnamed protein product, partial [Cylicostephanus goldi]